MGSTVKKNPKGPALSRDSVHLRNHGHHSIVHCYTILCIQLLPFFQLSQLRRHLRLHPQQLHPVRLGRSSCSRDSLGSGGGGGGSGSSSSRFRNITGLRVARVRKRRQHHEPLRTEATTTTAAAAATATFCNNNHNNGSASSYGSR